MFAPSGIVTGAGRSAAARVPTALLLLAAACVPAPDRAGLAAPAPPFDVARFFTGDSRGEAELRVLFHAPEPVRVRSHGCVTPDGTVLLDQDVAEGTKPQRHRQWRLREVAPGRWTGTLSDAAGPVAGEVRGNLLALRFAMKGGLQARQWLYLQPGGTVVLNRMTVSKWGVRVATLDETIRREP